MLRTCYVPSYPILLVIILVAHTEMTVRWIIALFSTDQTLCPTEALVAKKSAGSEYCFMNGCVCGWYHNNHYHGNSANPVSPVWQLLEFSSAFTRFMPTAVPCGSIVTVHGFSICGILRLDSASSRGQCWLTNGGGGATSYGYFVLSLCFVRHPEHHSPPTCCL